MHSRTETVPARRGLLALVVVALLLLFVATIVGGKRHGVQCASLPASAAESLVEPAAPALSTAPEERPPDPAQNSAPGASDSGSGATVRGFVVDERAQRPVPFLNVELRAGDHVEPTTTDMGGTFASRSSFEAGPLEIEVFDNGASYGSTRIEWDPRLANKQTRIAIDIGPTFLVDDIGRRRVQSADNWLLRIVQTPRPLDSAGEIEVRGQELSLAVGPEMVWTEQPLRFFERDAFARWPKVEHERAPEYRTRMVARSMTRCERGAVETGEPVGLLNLPAVHTKPFLLLSGKVDLSHVRSQEARVLIRPITESTRRRNSGVPDFREVAVKGGRYEVEVDADQRYSALLWGAFGEPTLISKRIEDRGRHSLPTAPMLLLRYPSFDPGVLAPEYRGTVERGLQIIRARVRGAGSHALSVVDTWEGFETPRPAEMLETRYEIDSIGVDCTPATMGLSWTQILPGLLVPDRLPSDSAPRPHRVEWVDRLLETVRIDALVTGGPGGVVVTTQETSLGAQWTLLPKSPLSLTVWKDGCEPVSVRAQDFNERGGEYVASVALRTGWGVMLSFFVIDSEVGGFGAGDWKSNSRERAAGKTFSSTFDFLGLPALSGVEVTSPQARGESDADGNALVRASTWPDRLRVRAAGYRLRELRRLPGGGARWIAYMEHDRYDR